MINKSLKRKLIAIFVLFTICSMIFFLNILKMSNIKMTKIESFFPKIKLGLDLIGGSHFTLKADVNSYLNEKYKKISLQIEKTNFAEIDNVSQNGINILYPSEEKLSEELKQIDSDLIFDKKMNLIYYNEKYKNKLISDLIQQSMYIIRNRVDNMGTKEIIMYKNSSDSIILQIPGYSEKDNIKNILNTKAQMSFHVVDPITPITTNKNQIINKNQMLLKDRNKQNIFYVINKIPSVYGEDLNDAKVSFDNIRPSVAISFNSKGTTDFAKTTASNVGRQLAIVIDDEVISAPNINEPILGGKASISGSFSADDLKNLAISLKSGALPAKIEIVEEKNIGPSLGKEIIKSSGIAIIMGLMLVLIFMFFYYKTMGLIAIFGLLMNLVLTTTIFALFDITLTLPGIAGLLLTLGMAIDANVLIYEKMKEFDRKTSTKLFLIQEGFKGAMSAIIDSNLTTIIAASTLILFGTAFVKGFAVSLTIGIICSFFTAITSTKILSEYIARKGSKNVNKFFV